MIKFLKSAVLAVAIVSLIIPAFGMQLALASDGSDTTESHDAITGDHGLLPHTGDDHRSLVAKCRLNDVEKIKQFRAEQKDKIKQIESDTKTARKAAFDAFKEARKNATTEDEKKAANQAFKDAMKKLQMDRKTAITDLKGQTKPMKSDCES